MPTKKKKRTRNPTRLPTLVTSRPEQAARNIAPDELLSNAIVPKSVGKRLKKRSKKKRIKENPPSTTENLKTKSNQPQLYGIQFHRPVEPSINPLGHFYENLDHIYDIIVAMHILSVILFVALTLLKSPCDDSSSLEDLDNVAAFVSTQLGMGSLIFSETVANTKPYNYMCMCLCVIGVAYLGSNVVCNRSFFQVMETVSIALIAHFIVYLVTYYTHLDFTPLTPILTYTYTFCIILNVFSIYYLQNNVPIVMLSIINLGLAFSLEICASQFALTQNPQFSLPERDLMIAAIILFSLHVTFNHQAVLLTFYLFGT